MTSKQRTLTALSCQVPDQVPVFELWINEPIIVRLAQLLTSETIELQVAQETFGDESQEIIDLYCAVAQELPLDATSYIISTHREAIGEGRVRDKFGTIYQTSEHGEPFPIEGPIKDRSDLRGFDMLSKLEADDFARVKYVVDKVGPEKAHVAMTPDPFKISWRLRGGMQNLLMDYVLDPQLVHGLARIATDYYLGAVDLAAQAGVDAIIMNGDLAGEETTLMSPEHYREYIKPSHHEIVDYVHHKGLQIIKHTDGNMWPILDDFLEVGFDGLHPIQPQCMDIGETKEYVAGRACIVGNIDCRHLLVFGSEEEVEQNVKETIETAAPGGGYIIASSNSIHPGVKPENYIAMVKAARKHGGYEEM